jgi:hypothetical protein
MLQQQAPQVHCSIWLQASTTSTVMPQTSYPVAALELTLQVQCIPTTIHILMQSHLHLMQVVNTKRVGQGDLTALQHLLRNSSMLQLQGLGWVAWPTAGLAFHIK